MGTPRDPRGAYLLQALGGLVSEGVVGEGFGEWAEGREGFGSGQGVLVGREEFTVWVWLEEY